MQVYSVPQNLQQYIRVNESLQPVISSCDVLKVLTTRERAALMIEAARTATNNAALHSLTIGEIDRSLGNVNIDQDSKIAGNFNLNIKMRPFATSTGTKILDAVGLPQLNFNNALFDKFQQVLASSQSQIDNNKARIIPTLNLQIQSLDLPLNSTVTIKPPQFCTQRACTPKKCLLGVCAPRICIPPVCTPAPPVYAQVTGIKTQGTMKITPTIEHICTDINLTSNPNDIFRAINAKLTNTDVTLSLDRDATQFSQTTLNALRKFDGIGRSVGVGALNLDRRVNDIALPRIEQAVNNAMSRIRL